MLDWIPFETFGVLALLGGVLVGFVLLSFGGDQLTRGAIGLADSLKINPIIIGLTVVSMATSMPEFFTSFTSVVKGSSGLAIGNIVGSNIANIGLIMGLSALVFPIVIRKRLFLWEGPLLVIVSVLFYWFSSDGMLSRIDGLILVLFMIVYLYFVIRNARSDQPLTEVEETLKEGKGLGVMKSCIYTAIGALLLMIGSEALVNSSVSLARIFNVSETLIGFTMVAVGTSLPELAASVAAVLKKEADLLAGNIVGSNLFNILIVGGGVALIKGIEVDQALFRLEYPAMLLLTIVLCIFFIRHKIVDRIEGLILLVMYLAIVSYSTFVSI
jgi:cation:H+ antiporter